MPRLTFEALMAPGGLLDAGSRLVTTLVETPFKKQQLQQQLQEAEINRAEQKKIRAEAFQREDQRTAKSQRVEYLKENVSAKERRAEKIRAALESKQEATLRAKLKAAGVKDPDIENSVKLMQSYLANQGLSGLGKTPEELGANAATVARKALSGLEQAQILTPEQAAKIATSPEFNLDEGLQDEYRRVTQDAAEAWDKYRKEVGVAGDIVKTRVFADQAQQALGIPPPAAAPVPGAPAEPLMTPGAPPAPAAPEPTGQVPYQGNAGQMFADTLSGIDQSLSAPAAGNVVLTPEERQRLSMIAAQNAMASYEKGARLTNQALAGATGLEDAAAGLPGGPIGGPSDAAKRAATTQAATARAKVPRVDPAQVSWDNLVQTYAAQQGITPEQMPEYLRHVEDLSQVGPGAIRAASELLPQEIAKARAKHQAKIQASAFSIGEPSDVSPDEAATIKNALIQKLIFPRLQQAATAAKKTLSSADIQRLLSSPYFSGGQAPVASP